MRYPNVPIITNRRLFDAPENMPGASYISARNSDWHRFAGGYRAAANSLVGLLDDRFFESGPACLPILFLYRHYIELSLKGLLLDAGELLDDYDPVPGNHPLAPIWARLRAHLDSIIPDLDETWLSRAGALIGEFDTVDSSSFTFRYPANKKGVANAVAERVVNMHHGREVMRELCLILESVGVQLDVLLDVKRDTDTEPEVYFRTP